MRPYEIMVILDAGLDDEVIRTTIDRTTKLLTDEGAKVGHVDRWGRRRFAYQVAHKSEGYYAVIELTAEPSAIAAVDRMLGLADEVIRHKVIRLPDKAAGRVPRPQAQESASAESSATGA